MSKSVLIIDDSTFIRSQIRDVLSGEGFEIVGEAKNGESGVDLAMELKPDIITLDNILPDMKGADVLQVLKEQGISSKVIMISAVGQQSVIQESIGHGASEYIVKPFTREELLDVVKKVLL